MTTLAAELTWTGERFERGLQLRLEGDRIAEIGHDLVDSPDVVLKRRALLPGFVNAHSHAFQRGLRGLGETFPAGAGSFWTWREAMYGLVESLDRDRLREVCGRAFREMRAAGITTVGEFHYLHHLSDNASPEFDADALVLDAAEAAGLRIVLLQAAYQRGGFDDRPLSGGQHRFDTGGNSTASLDIYWRQLDRLLERTANHPAAGVGVVAHSTRAVALDDLVALHRGACARGLVFHLHLEEQRQEIDDCRAHHGVTPMRLLLDHLGPELGAETTAVHCTHSDPSELAEFLATGANLCLCPTTEGDLGDGVAPLDVLADRGHLDQLSLGTDSNLRISMLEEMRWAEHVQRLHHERRGVLRDGNGHVGRPLLRSATAAGARALGLPTGHLTPGHLADFVVVDLGHRSLQGCPIEHLDDALVFGCGDSIITATWVGGEEL
ncbi:MAG: formimidoylglutamate deiminase [Acidobacteriota bacterium]